MNQAPDQETSDVLTRLERDGFAFVRNAASANDMVELQRLCSVAASDPNVARRGTSVYGIRDLLSISPGIREMVSCSPFINWATKISGASTRPVHGIYFDKIPGANWPVTWHQDVTIRVRAHGDIAGYEARSVKDGMVHMLPPVEVSEHILTLRIHLDDAESNHGALRVIPGSHRFGRLTNERLRQQHTMGNTVSCEVHSGDIMLMRPLLVHSSSACEHPGHRRVIHIDYASFDLPGGLEWHG